MCTVDLLPESFVNIFVQFCEEKYFGYASVRVLLRAHQKLISSEDELEDVTAKSLSCTSSNKNKSEKKIHHYDKDKTSVRESTKKCFNSLHQFCRRSSAYNKKIMLPMSRVHGVYHVQLLSRTSSTSRKNSLVSARVSLNGHRCCHGRTPSESTKGHFHHCGVSRWNQYNTKHSQSDTST